MKQAKSKKNPNQVRQGDILIERIPDNETTAKDISENGKIILAHGEVTGHSHALEDAREAFIGQTRSPIKIDGDLDHQFATQSILKLGRAAKLVHQEHSTIALAPGTHRVSRQREYHPEALRTVAD